jgi:hypothetical protein
MEKPVTTRQILNLRRPELSTLARVAVAGSLAAGAALGSVGAVSAYTSPGFGATMTCVEPRDDDILLGHLLKDSCRLVFTLTGPPGKIGGLTVHFSGPGRPVLSANATTNGSGVAIGPVVSGVPLLCALFGNSTYTGTVTSPGPATGTSAQTQACSHGITSFANGSGNVAQIPATARPAKVTAASPSYRNEAIAGAGGLAVLALAGTVVVAARRRRQNAQ